MGVGWGGGGGRGGRAGREEERWRGGVSGEGEEERCTLNVFVEPHGKYVPGRMSFAGVACRLLVSAMIIRSIV